MQAGISLIEKEDVRQGKSLKYEHSGAPKAFEIYFTSTSRLDWNPLNQTNAVAQEKRLMYKKSNTSA